MVRSIHPGPAPRRSTSMLAENMNRYTLGVVGFVILAYIGMYCYLRTSHKLELFEIKDDYGQKFHYMHGMEDGIYSSSAMILYAFWPVHKIEMLVYDCVDG